MPQATVTAAAIRACPCCGLAQRVPPVPARMRACCARCGTSLLERSVVARSGGRTAALAAAALVLYPVAVGLPILKLEQFGHANASSILEGTASLFSGGQVVVGIIVLLCSVVFPLGKLVALLVLSAGGLGLAGRHRVFTFRLVQWTGRWGMMDILLVAILVAAMKLGDLVTVTAGPAAFAFTACVVLSLLAAASFHPHGMWESEA